MMATDAEQPVRFRCSCGRTVATDEGSAADVERSCSRCRHRRRLGFGSLQRHDDEDDALPPLRPAAGH